MESDEDVVTVEVCRECGRHLHFLCGNGEASGEFFSQNQCEEVLRDFREDGDVSYAEFDRLMREIRESGLPMEIPDDMQYLLDLEENLLAFQYAIAAFDKSEFLDEIHNFFNTFFPQAPARLQ